MDRDEATKYYSQEFANPSGVEEAYDVSKAFLIINCIYVGLLLLFIPVILICIDSDDQASFLLGWSSFLALCARLSWLFTIPIVFHRINESYATA